MRIRPIPVAIVNLPTEEGAVVIIRDVKRISIFLFTSIALLLCGCQNADIDTPQAVQAAVTKYIESRGDLSLAELDITVENVNFSGDQCEAHVKFVPKGQPEASGMSMTYQLERDGDEWKVIPRSGGHGMQAPDPASGEGTPAAGAMPPGHPPVSAEPAEKK